MPKKRYWYRSGVVRDSGYYWVDFCFHWIKIALGEGGYIKKVVFQKRIRHDDGDLVHGFYLFKEQIIYLNPATRDGQGRRPLPKTLIHELMHALYKDAREWEIRDDETEEGFEQDLWDLSTEDQKAFLRNYLREQWIKQFGAFKKKRNNSKRVRARFCFSLVTIHFSPGVTELGEIL